MGMLGEKDLELASTGTRPEPGYGAVLSERGCLPLAEMAVVADVVGLLYRLRLTQTFVNAYPVPLEATYIFPLPLRSGVCAFRLHVGDRVVEGCLRERGHARQEYDAALAEGRRAAIAEEERSDVFTVRAGNIPQGEQVRVELELSGPLEFSHDEATFRFPLVVAPRYIPGVALSDNVGSGTSNDTDAVPDASRITPPRLLPGMPNPVRLSLQVNLDPAGLPFGSPRCSLHSVRITPGCVSLQPGTERLDRDFLLHIPVDCQQLRSSFVACPDGQGGASFMLTLVPPPPEQCGVKPRDVVVLLDRSGSMEGWKMTVARRAVARLLDSLTDQDRLGLIAFDTILESPFEGLVPAGHWQRTRALDFLNTVASRGGTEIVQAVERATHLFTETEEFRERAIVLVTDGQVGNEEQLLHQARAQGDVRIFTVGIDRAVNAGLLERLATITGGCFAQVESPARLEQAVRALHHRIGQPVLADVRLTGLPSRDQTPQTCDVYPGSPAFIYGQLAQMPTQTVLVHADQKPGVELPVHRREDQVITTAWARARILEMQDQYAAGATVASTITEFSLRWNVLSRFTAFVAQDEEVAVASSVRVQATVPVERPSGWATAQVSDGIGSYGGGGSQGSFGGFAAAGSFGAFGHNNLGAAPMFQPTMSPGQALHALFAQVMEAREQLAQGWLRTQEAARRTNLEGPELVQARAQLLPLLRALLSLVSGCPHWTSFSPCEACGCPGRTEPLRLLRKALAAGTLPESWLREFDRGWTQRGDEIKLHLRLSGLGPHSPMVSRRIGWALQLGSGLYRCASVDSATAGVRQAIEKLHAVVRELEESNRRTAQELGLL